MTWFKTLRDLLSFTTKSPCLCMVITEQEGAEIWVNDKNTHMVTPKAITVPRNTEVKITLRLTGHYEHTALVKSGHHLSYYHTKLQRVPLRLISNDSFEDSFELR